jgi:hypothetical protein
MKKLFFGSLVSAVLMGSLPAHADNHVTAISREDLSHGGMTTVSELLNELPRKELGLHLFYQDVSALAPGGTSTFGSGVIGLGASFSMRPNPGSPLYIRGVAGWGRGSEKLEDPGLVYDGTYSTLYGSAAAGLILPITRRGAVYGQGGLFYSTTRAEFEDDTNSIEGEPFGVFGIDTAIGLRYGVGSGNNSVFLEHYNQLGWGSGEDGDIKYSSTVKYGCFRGGYNFGF